MRRGETRFATLAAPMAQVPQITLSAEDRVRAYEKGELPWTLHKACEYASDPAQWGVSLINDSEIMLACLEAADVKSVYEVGAYAGDLTQVLLDWAEPRGARVGAIDPSPQPELVEMAQQRKALDLIRKTSLEALGDLPQIDAFVIDGDHNYYTVSEELRMISEASGAGKLPLLLFHDVSWPHARRDDYFAPELIPDDYRQPTKEGGGLFPGIRGTTPGGLPYKWPAAEEGGPRNGVLTAVEDFVAAHSGLRLAVVPAFYGLGLVWREDAPYADVLAKLLDPLDRNPIIERLEANRVLHLVSTHAQIIQVLIARDQARRQEAVLRRMLNSSAFGLAERLSRLRQRLGIAPGDDAVSKQAIREVLGG
jgi:Methyltransferase domain